MIKEVVRNGISTASADTYQPSMNTMKKHIMFANNSCQPMINSINNRKYLSKPLATIDLSEKRWFFVLLICLATIAVFNLGITFWIINVLKLTDTGIGFGSFVLTKKGIDIRNDITFDGTLNAKTIKGFDSKQALTLNSGDNENIVLKNNDNLDNSLSLGEGKLEIQTNNFQIRSTNPSNADNFDEILFDVQPNQITTYTKNFLLPTLGGHKIVNTLETDSIRGTLYHDLKLESRTQKVNINADKDIHLESKGGDIMSQSYDNTVLMADESIVFNSKRIEFKHLPKYHKSIDETNVRNSYQLCLCDSGQLFAVKPDSICRSDAEWCLSQTDSQSMNK